MWVTEQNNTVYATYSPGSGDKKDHYIRLPRYFAVKK